jgi:hypothetical protein
LNGAWFCIDKQEERKKEMLYHFFSILIEIALLCQKKDSYTDSVYSKDTLGTLFTISPIFAFIREKERE